MKIKIIIQKKILNKLINQKNKNKQTLIPNNTIIPKGHWPAHASVSQRVTGSQRQLGLWRALSGCQPSRSGQERPNPL